jgi:hypothetical protein
MSGDNLKWMNQHIVFSFLPDEPQSKQPQPEPEPMCTGLDPVRCDDPNCKVHGRKVQS